MKNSLLCRQPNSFEQCLISEKTTDLILFYQRKTTLKKNVVLGYPKPLNQEKNNVNKSVWIPENLGFCQLNNLKWHNSQHFRFKIQSIVHLGLLG